MFQNIINNTQNSIKRKILEDSRDVWKIEFADSLIEKNKNYPWLQEILRNKKV